MLVRALGLGLLAWCVGCTGMVTGYDGRAPADHAGDGDPAPSDPDDGDVPRTDELPAAAAFAWDDGDEDEALPEDPARLLYTRDRAHSPLTPRVTARLRAIAAAAPTANDDMFMKVGDSITESFAVMACFDEPSSYALDGRDYLLPAIEFFRAANVSGPSPCADTWCQGATNGYRRDCYTAESGSTADWPLGGGPPTWLEREVDAIHPRYALVQYGTNDATIITSAATRDNFQLFYRRMLLLVDELAARGVVPVLLTIPPYTTTRSGWHNPPTMNAIIRAIAQGRRVPLVDYYRSLLPLPDWGLWDGVHPKVDVSGCDFDAQSLGEYGHNVRNLLSMQALARLYEIIPGGATHMNLRAPGLTGDGSDGAPFAAPELPFSHLGSGGGVYSFTLATSARVRAMVLEAGAVMSVTLDGVGDALAVHADLGAGPHEVRVSGGAEYGLVVIECVAGDPSC